MTDRVLAGLVTEEAAEAYDRLHEAVHLPVGAGPAGSTSTTGPGGNCSTPG